MKNIFTKVGEISMDLGKKFDQAKIKHDRKIMDKKIEKCTKELEKYGVTVK